MDLREQIALILKCWDEVAEPIDEMSVGFAINAIVGSDGENLPDEILAEGLAFGFIEGGRDPRWGTYFGPSSVLSNGDGTVTESPSIHRVTPQIIERWGNRAVVARNPVLAGRYAGLVWDFSRKVCGKSSPVRYAQLWVDASCEIAEQRCHKYEFSVVEKLVNALSVARSIKDSTRIERVLKCVLEYHRYLANSHGGYWAFAFDAAVADPSVPLAEEQKQGIISTLESELQRFCDSTDEATSSIHNVIGASARLAAFYHHEQRHHEVARILKRARDGVVRRLKNVKPMIAISWLKDLYQLHLRFGQKKAGSQLLRLIREIGPTVKNDMNTHAFATEIRAEDLRGHVDAVLGKDLEESLYRIVGLYILRRSALEEQLDSMIRRTPIQFHVTHQVYDCRGRPVVEIPPVTKDREGHLIRLGKMEMAIKSIFLREVFKEWVHRFGVNESVLEGMIADSPLFPEEKRTLLRRGIKAFLEDDAQGAIHFLVPQLEDAVRLLVEVLGQPVLKVARDGEGNRSEYHYRQLGDLLRDKALTDYLGEELCFYLRTVLTDSRGWNLRNNVCHGIVLPEELEWNAADRLMHIFLLLAMITFDEVDASGANEPVSGGC